jgi:uncharacterized membrane-anchored protein
VGCDLNATAQKFALSKVPEVTLVFWIIKILATTLGETGGDTVTMTLKWGYLAGTALFAVLLVTLVIAQIVAKRFHPFLYWATIVASTTFGTTKPTSPTGLSGSAILEAHRCCFSAS